MTRYCLDSVCLNQNQGPHLRPLIRKGRYFRRSDGQWVRRFGCSLCGKRYSSSHFGACFRQKKRKLNLTLAEMLSSGVSQRRAAFLLRVNRKTVVRKFRFMANQARIEQLLLLRRLERQKLSRVQFDDLETHEHTKLKPVSVALAVDPGTRKILSFQVSRAPSKGLLARRSYKKYGPRPDERARGWRALFTDLRPVLKPDASLLSDQNPHYPVHLKRLLPTCRHETVKGARGCVAGQGELKRLVWDPLFTLNHTCAMLRANLNRLFRRTWSSTKTLRGLRDHLALYVSFHNRCLVPTGPL
jgi:transposase-like protein